ncbi:MAG: hypothetical protein EHM20_16355 [Alphaproteobacteria bacterium]|nr:MAG: hypothetical protein EHM20_16355 [Alphaproteobacteria bacterium]
MSSMNIFKKTSYLFISLLGFQTISEARWTLNDVTYLMPLPAQLNEVNVLTPFSKGNRGTILPFNIVKNFEALDKHEALEESYRKLKVVAIRLDPCFKMSGICKSQIRIVFQPLNIRWGKTISQDTAVHAFYNLSDNEFREFLRKLEKIKVELPASAYSLQVHPTITKEGYNGKFASSFFPLILSYIGEKNLVRVTAMQLSVGADKWIFLGFDIENGLVKEISIPRVKSDSQSFRVATVNGRNFFRGQITPVPVDSKDLFGELIVDPKAILNPEVLKNAAVATRRIENPDLHSPDTIDCVTCHLTAPAGGVVFETSPELLMNPEVERWTFSDSLENLTMRKRDVRVLRSLGYFDSEPITNNRVINESQAVVDYLNFKF